MLLLVGHQHQLTAGWLLLLHRTYGILGSTRVRSIEVVWDDSNSISISNQYCLKLTLTLALILFLTSTQHCKLPEIACQQLVMSLLPQEQNETSKNVGDSMADQ